ncbi:MAG: hypothetical protein M0Q13_12585 [Methanothrix sp.]|jgi:archaellum component FlaF (FlaF/FlaG flagellin family)|nr:hypothetical protein [Methanothrix sp.]
MRYIIISALVLFALVYSSCSQEPVSINQETGMSILANITPNSTNQSDTNRSINQSLNNQTEIDRSNSGTGLWSWGKIPAGYELNKNGTLTKMADEEWKPSI